VDATSFVNGHSTWNQDLINVTISPSTNARAVPFTGRGVYVAVLDTGLVKLWRQYFPEERIATQYATGFSGGGGENGNISEPPNQWEHDADSHGTHVTSTILGFQDYPTRTPHIFQGTAPLATIIPVKVLNQTGYGWSSVVARGIVYVANLKAGPLAGSPVIINMSLGGPGLDAIDKAAIDYAISKGVIIVAAAGNEGELGMIFPGAYPPVISAGAVGWVGQWRPGGDGIVSDWWWKDDVSEPTRAGQIYVADFSSREKPGQDLDVLAPGYFVVGPYNLQNGQISYYYLTGTSMATPHVSGICALMAQKDPALTAPQAETILTQTAIPVPPGSRTVLLPTGTTTTYSWDSDATGSGFTTADAALAATP
jgi:subtilisin family serine protease